MTSQALAFAETAKGPCRARLVFHNMLNICVCFKHLISHSNVRRVVKALRSPSDLRQPHVSAPWSNQPMLRRRNSLRDPHELILRRHPKREFQSSVQ